MDRELECPPCDPGVSDAVVPSTPAPPFDLQNLLAEWAEEPEFLARMLDVFVRDTRADLEALSLAFAVHDHSKLARTAHRLKGAAGVLGAEAMREQAALLESMGRAGELSDAAVCLARLHDEFGRFQDFLSDTPLATAGTRHIT